MSVRADYFVVFDKVDLPQSLEIRRKDCVRREIFWAPDKHLAFEWFLLLSSCIFQKSRTGREEQEMGGEK